jgi:hypothetical protein
VSPRRAGQATRKGTRPPHTAARSRQRAAAAERHARGRDPPPHYFTGADHGHTHTVLQFRSVARNHRTHRATISSSHSIHTCTSSSFVGHGSWVNEARHLHHCCSRPVVNSKRHRGPPTVYATRPAPKRPQLATLPSSQLRPASRVMDQKLGRGGGDSRDHVV